MGAFKDSDDDTHPSIEPDDDTFLIDADEENTFTFENDTHAPRSSGMNSRSRASSPLLQ
ncbi:hypothetical protein DFQ27_001909, partial [Actinomortierella ambigua]